LVNLILTIVLILLVGSAAIGYVIGVNGKTVSIQTQTQTISVTTTASYIQYLGTLTQTQIQTQVTTSVTTTTSTLTDTVSFTKKLNSTTTTTTTATRTLGTGVSISDYRLFMTNVSPDSVFKLNLMISLVMNQPTYLTEVTNVILTPFGGNANDIKFIPNPIITQTSDYTTVLSMYAILDHQIVAGTYIIEYSVSTSQGSAVAYTIVEVIR